jgi:hypothetical protein
VLAKSVLITQSNYIPWKGYFDALNLVDQVILYDEAQYTRRDWRNRNRIVTPHGVRWLTIPVSVKGKYHQSINETQVADPRWHVSHWGKIKQYYKDRDCFSEFETAIEKLYDVGDEPRLSKINERFILGLCEMLGIETEFSRCEEFSLSEGRNQRLIDLCTQVGATRYYSGPSAKGYLDESAFQKAGISVHWLDFTGYPEYPQATDKFDHHVSVVDLIFNVGREAPNFMKTF